MSKRITLLGLSRFLANCKSIFASKSDLKGKQNTLVNQQNIKSINGKSILGRGNLIVQGAGGIEDVNVSVDNSTGIPSAAASFDGSTLSIIFHNLKGTKGEQGNTGASINYPYELINNLKTYDATKGLSAQQGVYLNKEVSGTFIVENNAFIGGWKIVAGSAFVKQTNNKRVGVDYFDLKQGDKIILSDYTKCKMYVGWRVGTTYYSSGEWLTSDYTATVDGEYVLTLEGIPDVALSDVSDLTKYLLIIRPKSQIEYNYDAIKKDEVQLDLLEHEGVDIVNYPITISALESGTIKTTGDNMNSNSTARSVDYIKVEQAQNIKFIVSINFDELKTIISSAEKVNFNIHCYNDNKESLGRCTEGYQAIENSYVLFTALQNTAYIRITFTINNDVNISSYVSSINTSRNQIISLSEIVPVGSLVSKIDGMRDDIDAVYPSLPFRNTGNNDVLGEKIDISHKEYSSSQIGKLSSASGGRQGGAIYGDYLFQFHNTLEKVVVFKLSTATNVQTITNTAISDCHAGSGGFSDSFYDSGDYFPLLYISSMGEKKVYVFRITGEEGSFSMTKVQEITLNIDFYLPNITIDAANKRVVVFGYTQNSWSVATNNESVICFFGIPSVSLGDVTISSFYNKFKLPFIYAQQGACAQYGKLYLSFGNTGAGLNTGGVIVVDYVNRNVDSYLDLAPVKSGSFEPEAFCIWGESFIVTEYNGRVYKITFDDTSGTHSVPSGGTTGQVLTKASGTDYDLEWTTPPSGGGSGALGKIGVISQTQTWSGTGSNPRTYVMSNQVTGLIPQANIDLFEVAGAVFNESTGYFELNGLTDLSYEEMKAIYTVSGGTTFGLKDRTGIYAFVKTRTVLPLYGSGQAAFVYNITNAFYRSGKNNTGVEVIGMNVRSDTTDKTFYIANQGLTNVFYECYLLRKIDGIINLYSVTTAPTTPFKNCYSLEDVNLYKLKTSISFAESPNLSKASLLYMINNEATTGAITITLHASVYAKCQTGGEWYSDISTALSNHPNVSLASA